MKWVKMNRDLKEGDIIRCKITKKEHPKYGQWVYAICSGEGFGCSMSTIGNAIFVIHENFDLEEVLKHRNDKEKVEWSRWERFWGIDVLEESK
jgi:hypothetical protein